MREIKAPDLPGVVRAFVVEDNSFNPAAEIGDVVCCGETRSGSTAPLAIIIRETGPQLAVPPSTPCSYAADIYPVSFIIKR